LRAHLDLARLGVAHPAVGGTLARSSIFVTQNRM
jgi:hypothetical protein